MAWTRKSIVPHFSLSTRKVSSIAASLVTSHSTSVVTPISAASGSTRFFSASPW